MIKRTTRSSSLLLTGREEYHMAYRPLADEIRPSSLDEVVGQRHILGPDGVLRRLIDSGNTPI
jgi:replication-associated recombination protein RarA